MEVINKLFWGFPEFWGGGVAHSLFILSLVLTIGLALSKVKVHGISLGVSWILFAGLVMGHFNMMLDEHLLHFLMEFGLVLFVYSIGLEVGPGFFASFRGGGRVLNGLVAIIVGIGVVTLLVIYFITGTPFATLAGVASGAVTNTPALGAAQQAFSDLHHVVDNPSIATGYSVAYPIGVLGVIAAMVILRYAMRVDMNKEEEDARRGTGYLEKITLNTFTVKISNSMIDGKAVREVHHFLKRDFMISRIFRPGDNNHHELVKGDTILNDGDVILVVAHPQDEEPICALMGEKVEMDWEQFSDSLISRRILITKSELNGKTIAQLQLRSSLGANITRVNRSGVDLVATPHLKLQMGDRVTVVGSELAVSHAEKVMGNSLKRLNAPNLIPIFLGIFLGCLLANVPFFIPGISENLRLGLTGGPFIIASLMGYFGPKYNLVTYNTISANLMLREVGFCIFLACVGLATGRTFVATIESYSGLIWIFYGFLITMIPVLLGGIIGRYCFHINFFTLMGVLAGCNTNPPALSFVGERSDTDSAAVGYSTVYPFAMFLRIITLQILVFIFA